MSRTTIKARLAELEKQHGIGLPTPSDVLIRFIKSDGLGRRLRPQQCDRILVRTDGTYRLPPEELRKL